MLFLFVLLLILPACATTGPVIQPKTYSQSETAIVQGIQYVVYNSNWLNGKQLLVDIGVTNIGDEALKNTFKPSFSLIDQNDRRYEPRTFDPSLSFQNLPLKLMQPLNPGVEVRGFLAFDVPDSENIKLMVVSPSHARVGFAGNIERVGPYAYVILSPKKYQPGSTQYLHIISGSWTGLFGMLRLQINEKGIVNGKFIQKGITKILSGNVDNDIMKVISKREDGSDKKDVIFKVSLITDKKMALTEKHSGIKFEVDKIE
jgi:hypothetical protein